MKISTPVLGMLAMAAAPFLFLSLYIDNGGVTSLGGLCGLVYMAGWTATIIALLRLNVTGPGIKNKIILYVQLGTLTLAQVWNIWTIVSPQESNPVYAILDLFWPLSNITLLVAGIIIAVKGILPGRKRYIVLAAGLWLPFSFIVLLSVGNGLAVIVISGLYSTIAWFNMGYIIWKNRLNTEPGMNEILKPVGN